MAGKQIEAEILSRLESRTRLTKVLVRYVFVVFCISFGFVVVATAVPQRRLLKQLEVKVVEARERERVAMAERDHRRIELQALREDPAYLEIHARDRLDVYRDGEKVLRFKRER